MQKPKRSLRRLPTGPAGPDAPGPFAGRCLAALQAVFEHLRNPARPSRLPGPDAAVEAALVLVADVPGTDRAKGWFDAGQLSRTLCRTLHAQFAAVHRRIQAVQWLVLINDWPEVERLWSRLAADLRTPMLELNFLAELVRPQLHEIRVDGHALVDVLDHLNLLHARIEAVLTHRSDLIELSNLLDYQLAPQVMRLQRFLQRLEAARPSAV